MNVGPAASEDLEFDVPIDSFFDITYYDPGSLALSKALVSQHARNLQESFYFLIPVVPPFEAHWL